MESTLILFKPDCLERRLVGTILARFESKGLTISAMKLMQITPDLAQKHYSEHIGKEFYPRLEQYITSGPIIAAVLTGRSAISVVRKMVGLTNGLNAEPGTVRGDYAMSTQRNLIHASDSPESASREINIFFSKQEMIFWNTRDTEIRLTPQEIAEA